MAEQIKTQTQGQGVATIRQLLDKLKPQIAMALPKHMDAGRLLRIVMTSIQVTPKLLECTQVSLIACVIKAAQFGVEPDGVHAHLIPRRNRRSGVTEATLLIDYKGLIDLAARSGRVRIAPPVAVHANDKFHFTLGDRPSIEHVPYEGDGDPGPLTHVYAIARYNDGFDPDFVVLPKSEIERHRRFSGSPNDGPWVDNYEEMAKKTAVRVICKYVPSSPELAKAVALDEKGETGLPQDLDIDVGIAMPGEPEPTRQTNEERLIDKLESEPANFNRPQQEREPEPVERQQERPAGQQRRSFV